MEFEKVWFREARHIEEINATESNIVDKELWRKSKDRTKTVSVALVLCLNIAVDPPDVPRNANGPRKQAWVEPVLCSPQKSANKIAISLQSNYEKLQPRARYKTAIDPTIESVRKLCQTLRRNAKEERVLFHFNGHGVPRPTDAGEIWVFNRTITQYIPLSLYDLQSWMGSPSVYVWDCNSAGTIVNMFTRFAEEQQIRALQSGSRECKLDESIQMGACRAGELLPQHPDLPADLFTSCLTTPIQTSLLWYMIKTTTKSKYPADIIEELPGQLTDRRTVLGELNWIFTAITDTIAWNALSTETFQRLFRQDLLTASLFRSFLLAERIMLENSCQVISQPSLPSVASHPLWEYWDYTMDICLNNISNLRCLKQNILCLGRSEFFVKSFLKHDFLCEIQPYDFDGASNFFVDHLKAFEVWLKFGCEKKKPPSELPVILQVLLSQSHRVQALQLLAKFVDLGAWAVGAALSVGIFPYVLKLLQSTDPHLRGPLAFIWAKILCVDPECQHELIKENGYFYFIQILNDSNTKPRMKIVPAFVMATLIDKRCRIAQEKLVQSDYMTLCMELLASNEVIKCKMLCLWLLIGLGRLWAEYDKARWNAIRNVAYERAMDFLTDELPEVRAAAVYALGCFVRNRSVNNEHATTIDNEVCDKMCEQCTFDGSVLVRAELTVAIQWFMIDFEQRFSELFIQLNKQFFAKQFENMEKMHDMEANGYLKTSESKQIIQFGYHGEMFPDHLKQMVYSNMKYLENKAFNDPFERIWLSLLYLCFDSFPYVATMARRLVKHIHELATHDREHKLKKMKTSVSPDFKIDKIISDRNPKVKFSIGSPMTAIDHKEVEQLKKCASINDMLNNGLLQTSSTSFTPKRNIYGSQSGRYTRISEEVVDQPVEALVTTQFSEWSSKSFQEPIFKTIYEEVSTSTRNSLVDGSSPFTQVKPTDWALHTYEGLRQKAVADAELFKNEKIRCDVQHVNIPVPKPQTSMVWSVLRPYLFTCDGAVISIFNADKLHNTSHLKGCFDASTERILGDSITELMVCNGLTHELLLTGSMNGVLKVWDPMFHEHGHEINGDPQLITTAHLLKDQSRVKGGKENTRNSTLYRWDQDFGRLVTSGNVRVCRIWDAWAEQVQRDIQLKTKTEVVSAMSVSLVSNLISCGFRDGVVNVLDVRLPPAECEIMKFHDFGSAILGSAITPENQGIIVGAADGDFRVWEPRMYQEPVVEFNVFKDTFSSPPPAMRFSSAHKSKSFHSVHAVDIQPHGQLISCAASDGFVRLFDVCGKKCLAQTRYGPESRKVGPSSIRFHSHKVMIGFGNEKSVYAFGAPNF